MDHFFFFQCTEYELTSPPGVLDEYCLKVEFIVRQTAVPKSASSSWLDDIDDNHPSSSHRRG